MTIAPPTCTLLLVSVSMAPVRCPCVSWTRPTGTHWTTSPTLNTLRLIWTLKSAMNSVKLSLTRKRHVPRTSLSTLCYYLLVVFLYYAVNVFMELHLTWLPFLVKLTLVKLPPFDVTYHARSHSVTSHLTQANSHPP